MLQLKFLAHRSYMGLGKQPGQDSEQHVLVQQPEVVAGTAAVSGNAARSGALPRVQTLPQPTRVLGARGAPSKLPTSPAVLLWFKPGAEPVNILNDRFENQAAGGSNKQTHMTPKTDASSPLSSNPDDVLTPEGPSPPHPLFVGCLQQQANQLGEKQ